MACSRVQTLLLHAGKMTSVPPVSEGNKLIRAKIGVHMERIKTLMAWYDRAEAALLDEPRTELILKFRNVKNALERVQIEMRSLMYIVEDIFMPYAVVVDVEHSAQSSQCGLGDVDEL